MKIQNYQLGLLYLVHLLISADGVIDESEQERLLSIKKFENIPDDVFKEAEDIIIKKSEKDLYQEGIDLINTSSDGDKLNAFAHLYKMSEADGRVHVKEVRLLLYSIRSAKLEFNAVVDRAKQITY